jgi:hypothetical protein
MEKDGLSDIGQALFHQSFIYVVLKIQTELDWFFVWMSFIKVVNINL